MESQLAGSDGAGVCFFKQVAWPKLKIRPDAAITSLTTRKVRHPLIKDGTNGNKREMKSLATRRITRTRSPKTEAPHTKTSPKGRQYISGRR